MSLEQELARNTEAMIALTAALTAHAAPAPAEKVKPPKPVVVVVTSPETSLPVGSSPTTTVAPETTSTQATTGGIEYAQVAKAITDTFKVNRAKTIETLAMFGATKGPQLKPEDYARFLKVLAE